MLRFTVRQLESAGRHLLLLPKLNSSQLGVLADRLKEVGYTVEGSPLMKARSHEGSLTVDPKGLCWSALDPADAVLPAMPGLLAVPKEEISADEIRSLYYKVAREGDTTLLRLTTRLEASATWDRLRGDGGCGLAPDEHLVATRLLEPLAGSCRVVTDFPVDGSIPCRVGRTTLFTSELPCPEAASTLRAEGEMKPRNSYLPRSGIVEIRSRGTPFLGDNALDDLGEWCSFRQAR